MSYINIFKLCLFDPLLAEKAVGLLKIKLHLVKCNLNLKKNSEHLFHIFNNLYTGGYINKTIYPVMGELNYIRLRDTLPRWGKVS